MNSRNLHRWAIVIAVVAVLTTVGIARSVLLPSTPLAAAPGSGGVAVSASGSYGVDAVMPTRFDTASGYEHDVRVKLPGFGAAVLVMAFAEAVARRAAFRRPQRSRLPLALRARSQPLRAPPALLLG